MDHHLHRRALLSLTPVVRQHLLGAAHQLLAAIDHVGALCLVALHLLLAPVHAGLHALSRASGSPPRTGTDSRSAAGRLTAVALLTAILPAIALAHGALRRSEPAANARLAAAPRELRLTFTEAVELAVARLTLTGPSGDTVALAPLTLAPDSAHVLVTAIRAPLVAGRYTVAWQVAGRDGHPVRGRYGFTLLPGATGLANALDTAAAGTAPFAGGDATSSAG